MKTSGSGRSFFWSHAIASAFIYCVGPWLVIPPFAIGVVVRLVQGHTMHAVSDAVVLVVYSPSWLLLRKRWGDIRRTARANGWGTANPSGLRAEPTKA